MKKEGEALEDQVLEEIRRKIVKSYLETIFLAELRKNEPLSAYELIDVVHSKFGFKFSSGTVYTLLYSMERKHLLMGEAAENKRVYRLTQKGKETIDTILDSREELWEFTKTIF
ncbi:helix-turn-helix transcriptional regulator [Candidatus Bathyarchaeota archaeon]|nr:helix-turn-helix transcriptional regulator [Candidatus Bathyarchaeota archaeon]